jgi:hypothetical protein
MRWSDLASAAHCAIPPTSMLHSALPPGAPVTRWTAAESRIASRWANLDERLVIARAALGFERVVKGSVTAVDGPVDNDGAIMHFDSGAVATATG